MAAAACGVFLGFLLAPPTQAAVRAHLDTDRIAPGETVQLILEHDGQTAEQPDLEPLRRDFDVLVSSRSSSVQIINGSVTSRVRTQLTLSPKRSGQLLVPALQWGDESSPELVVTVTGSAVQAGPGSPAAAGGRVFVETVVGQHDPFVQAAVNVTVRVYTTDQLYQASLDLPASNDALVQQIGGDENRTVERNGLRYDVVERHYVLFPQRSGALQLPGPVLTAQIPVRVRDAYGSDPFADSFGIAGGLMTSTKPIHVSGDPIDLDVRPRPAKQAAAYWLPARAVTLTADWRPEPTEAHVGDPVNVSMHLQADGLTAAQLPDLSTLLTLPAGLKVYPDQPRLNNVAQGDRIVGTRDQNVALIADQPGRFEVPAVTVAWWDTKTDQPRETSLPGRTITVLPAVNAVRSAAQPVIAANPAPPAAPTAHNDGPSGSLAARLAALGDDGRRWLWLSMGLALLWAATLLAWWLSRRRRRTAPTASGSSAPASPAATGSPGGASAGTPRAASSAAPGGATVPGAAAAPRAAITARAARTQFQEACRRSAAAPARRHLLEWAAVTWPENPPSGLQALASQLAGEELRERLAELDRACFAGEAWSGAELAALLRELPARPPPAPGGGVKIAPLYP
jgi:hypothetical protein